MASSKPILTDTFPVSADLSADQFLFVTLNSSGLIILPAAEGDLALGVLDDTPRAGTHGTVVMAGIAKVIAGTSITPMQQLSADTTGKAIAADTGDTVVALALQAAASGDVFSVLLTPSGFLHA